MSPGIEALPAQDLAQLFSYGTRKPGLEAGLLTYLYDVPIILSQ